LASEAESSEERVILSESSRLNGKINEVFGRSFHSSEVGIVIGFNLL
jgi:hypothetical protein